MMIDLRDEGLPVGLEVGGLFFPIETDFRVWIRWAIDAQTARKAGSYIFTGDVPDDDRWVEAAAEFAACKTETPHGLPSNGPRVFDYIEDGGRIVAAFQQCYGIDLTDCHMHWWRFRALLDNLPDGTALGKVMQYRGYTKPSREKDAEHQYWSRMKRAYSLPALRTPEDARAIEVQKEAFGRLHL